MSYIKFIIKKWFLNTERSLENMPPSSFWYLLANKNQNLKTELNFVCNNLDTQRGILALTHKYFDMPGIILILGWSNRKKKEGTTMGASALYILCYYITKKKSITRGLVLKL